MSRYKVGDFVIIKRDLSLQPGYRMYGDDPLIFRGFGVVPEMMEYCGMTAKIVGFTNDGTWASNAYILCIDRGRWKWVDGMLEGGG